ncbi:MAG: transglycosylase SLT domain-containing protein, partial [Acidobacteriota bacterium]
ALRPADLDRPAVAIALGAAYLRRLSDDFDGVTPHMIAAYNAGEPQAALWARYCFSDDPAEFYSKVTFRETRNYVRKVLRSYAHYRDLYGADLPANLSADGAPAAAQPPPSTPTPARSAPNGR